MHACLHVNEILRLIASEVVASKGKATAVALACCCKSFEDPVLDALWETQDQLAVLLKTFPKDVWNKGKRTVSVPASYAASSLKCFIRKLGRLPTTLELACFRKYARRMRKLGDFWTLNALHSEVFLILQRFSFNEPLLPNLKTLHLPRTNAEVAPFLLLFVSPATTIISIGFQTPYPP